MPSNGSVSGSAASPKPAVVCVFCASRPGNNPAQLASARALAQAFHAANIHLVYGGGTVGIMGELARTLVQLSGPGSVHGIIPRALITKEQGHKGTPTGEQQNSGTPTSTGISASAPIKTPTRGPEKTLSTSALQQLDTDGDLSSLIDESEYGTTTVVPDMHTRKRMMAQKVFDGGPGSGFVALAGGFGTLEEVIEMVTWNQLGIHPMPIIMVNVDGYWDGMMAWMRNAVKEGFITTGERDYGAGGECRSGCRCAEAVPRK